jgi:hypothetical protein
MKKPDSWLFEVSVVTCLCWFRWVLSTFTHKAFAKPLPAIEASELAEHAGCHLVEAYKQVG